MAISHVLPLLLLLGSLFLLPVLRAIVINVKFEYCNKSGYSFGNVSRVAISPNSFRLDDLLRITVYGYNNERFYEGDIDVFAQSKDNIVIIKRYELCKMTPSCAINPGTNFMLPLTDVFKYVLDRGDYKYGVALFDEGVFDGRRARMCIKFDLPTLTPTLVSLNS